MEPQHTITEIKPRGRTGSDLERTIILADMDDTIVNRGATIIHHMEAALLAFGKKVARKELEETNDFDDIINASGIDPKVFWPHFDTIDTPETRIRDIKKGHIAFYADTLPFLHALGKRTIIVTNTPYEKTQPQAELLGLDTQVIAIYAPSQIDFKNNYEALYKPHHSSAMTALTLGGYTPQNGIRELDHIFVVGDGKADMQLAENLQSHFRDIGISTVVHGIHIHRRTGNGIKADIMVDGTIPLLKALNIILYRLCCGNGSSKKGYNHKA